MIDLVCYHCKQPVNLGDSFARSCVKWGDGFYSVGVLHKGDISFCKTCFHRILHDALVSYEVKILSSPVSQGSCRSCGGYTWRYLIEDGGLTFVCTNCGYEFNLRLENKE